MHRWGDEGVDWNGISSSASEIGTFLKRWGRIGVRDTKEKYGTVRVYLSLGWYQLHSITHPGYVFSQYPKWLWKLDCLYLYKIFRLLNYIVVPYHIWLYKLAYKRAVTKRPHLVAEIICGADYYELLEDLFPEWHKWNNKEIERKNKEWEEECKREEAAEEKALKAEEARKINTDNLPVLESLDRGEPVDHEQTQRFLNMLRTSPTPPDNSDKVITGEYVKKF